MKLACSLFVIAFGCLAQACFAQDRMPPLAPDKMTPAQKKSVELLSATPRGAAGVGGPFVPLLRSPELMDRLQNVGEYLRFKSSLPQKLVEMTILMIGRQWTQQYEWFSHYPLALKQGLKPEVANAIAEGRRPGGMTDEEEMVWDFNTELMANKSVSDGTYARIVKKFGEQGAVDLTGVNGYYTTLAMVMSMARTPSPTSPAVLPLVPYTK